MRWLAVLVVLLGACGGGSEEAATTTTAAPTTEATTTTTTEATTTTVGYDPPSKQDEADYMDATSLAFGIGTVDTKMLEYGYQLCDLYVDRTGTIDDVIADFAITEDMPQQVALELGSAAAIWLCPGV